MSFNTYEKRKLFSMLAAVVVALAVITGILLVIAAKL